MRLTLRPGPAAVTVENARHAGADRAHCTLGYGGISTARPPGNTSHDFPGSPGWPGSPLCHRRSREDRAAQIDSAARTVSEDMAVLRTAGDGNPSFDGFKTDLDDARHHLAQAKSHAAAAGESDRTAACDDATAATDDEQECHELAYVVHLVGAAQADGELVDLQL